MIPAGMPAAEQVAIVAVVLCCIYLGLVIIVVACVSGRRPPTREDLCEREDANGSALLCMVRELRAREAEMQAGGCGPSRSDMRRWSRECTRIAIEHQEAINTLSLDALQSFESAPADLGDWIGARTAVPAQQERRHG